MGERFRPCNGSEGEWFTGKFCDRCERDRAYRESDGAEDGCVILANTLVFTTKDAEYPKEWIYDAEGKPTCTAFVPVDAPPSDVELEAAGQLALLTLTASVPNQETR